MNVPGCLYSPILLQDSDAFFQRTCSKGESLKCSAGGALFRAYPGPWQVYRRLPNMEMIRVQTQEKMPTLKQVALEILPAT